MKPSGEMPIGELSRQAGCAIETIRYYERIGLLPAPPRSHGGHRAYGASDLRRLNFVRRARELGFTLDQVRELLRLAAGTGQTCSQAHDLAAAHLAEIRARLADLQAMEQALASAVRACEVNDGPGCPLLDCLAAAPNRPTPDDGMEERSPSRPARQGTPRGRRGGRAGLPRGARRGTRAS